MSEMKIKFLFMPFDLDKKLHVIEKAEGGKKRRYLKGISSGIQKDGHGERMTPECMKDFMDQANSGDVLLYPDLHGVRGTDDIGILTKASITPEGDWMTEYRLYDEADGVGTSTVEKADKMWKQINGLPPYRKPRQKGFSIEGHIPDEGLDQMDSAGKRVINKVLLDGVVVVPRPAYKPSVAQAIYKALDLPVIRKSITTRLSDQLIKDEIQDQYYRKKYKIQDGLEEEIKTIMCDPAIEEKEERLQILFDEYKSLMLPIIIQSAELFTADAAVQQASPSLLTRSETRMEVYKALNDTVKILYAKQFKGGIKNA